MRLGFEYDDLIMYPNNYRYEAGNFIMEGGIILDPEVFGVLVGSWKAQTCLELGVSVAFDDSDAYVRQMRAAGIATIHVNMEDYVDEHTKKNL